MKCFFFGHKWQASLPYFIKYESEGHLKEAEVPIEVCIRCKKVKHKKVIVNNEISLEIMGPKRE